MSRLEYSLKVADIEPFKSDMSGTIYRRTVIGAIILLGILLYVHTLHYPFVWDGRGYILNNPLIKGFDYYDDIFNFREFANSDEILGIPSDFVTNFSLRPVTYLTFTINYLLGGTNPAGYRAVNIGIHILNAVLVFLLLERIVQNNADANRLNQLSKRLIMTVPPLLFLCHPLQTESVIYIVQRFTSLATSFYLLTAYLFICAVTAEEKRRGMLSYLGSVAALLVGMLVKETVFTAPVILLVLATIVVGIPFKASLKKVLPHLLCLPLIPVLVVVTSSAQNNATFSLKGSINVINFYSYSPLHYAITQLCTMTTYFRLLLFPYGQNVDYDYPLYTSLFQGKVLLALALLSALVLAALICFRRNPREIHRSLILFGIVFFFVSISVTSSIVPMAELIAERRTYLPSIGAFIAIVCAVDLARLTWGRRISGSVMLAGVAGLLIILCIATHVRSTVWRSRISFWQDATAKSPGKLRPKLGLVAAYIGKKRYEEAAGVQRLVIAMLPNDATHYQILQELQYLQGGYTDSIETGVHALSLDKGNASIYYFLGLAYDKVGMSDDAEQALNYAITLQPAFTDAHLALARFHSDEGNYEEALEQYRATAKLDAHNKTVQTAIRDLEQKLAHRRNSPRR